MIAPTTVALGVDLPAFARSDQHDVLLLGIDEHVADALQAGKVFYGVGQRLVVLQAVVDRRFEPAERNLARFGGLV